MEAIKLVVLSFLIYSSSASDISSDKLALLDLFRSLDPNNTTEWNTSDLDPCKWPGVLCRKPDINRTTQVRLENMNLRGTIDGDALGRLDELRVLSLQKNLLTGSIPDNISSLVKLKNLYLSNNNISGAIPKSMGRMRNLHVFMLDHNQVQGGIPPELLGLPGLTRLRLEYNSLTGSIPDANFPADFNLSYNNLSGPVPERLRTRDQSALAGNPYLCLNCTPLMEATGSSHKNIGGTIIIATLFSIGVLSLIVLLLLICFRKKENEEEGVKKDVKAIEEPSVESTSLPQLTPEQTAELIFVNEDSNKFELKDLLRASAEMLGKGTVGTTYKAIMGEGIVLAVKRLIDRSLCDRTEFEQHMHLIGKLKHPNLVPLVAYYYYAKQEKLLVYDHHPNGNLYSLLHGNRSGAERKALSWSDRLKIAHGVGQGLAFLHEKCPKMPHGNIKSTNILFDEDFVPRITDFGLAQFMGAVTRGPADGYRAPEQYVSKTATYKADVYSYGVMLLELLTGRVAARQGTNVDLPKWVNSVVREEWTAEVFDYELGNLRNAEEEMVYLLRIAMDCVTPHPEQRPKMPQVVKMIEDIIEATTANDASFSSELPSMVHSVDGSKQ